jgi:hypothetical protein
MDIQLIEIIQYFEKYVSSARNKRQKISRRAARERLSAVPGTGRQSEAWKLSLEIGCGYWA